MENERHSNLPKLIYNYEKHEDFLFQNFFEVLYKEKFLNKKENIWENYLRMIEKYLSSIVDMNKIKLNELLDVYKFDFERENNKKLEIKTDRFNGATNYFAHHVIKNVKILNKFTRVLQRNINNFNKIYDLLENKILEFLCVCEKNKNFIDDKNFDKKFNELIILAVKLFSNLN